MNSGGTEGKIWIILTIVSWKKRRGPVDTVMIRIISLGLTGDGCCIVD